MSLFAFKPARSQRRYELIVFDWDGTLFDSTALIVRCIQGACRDLSIEPPDDRRAAYVIGLGLRDALAYAVPGLDASMYAELSLRYRHQYVARRDELTLFDGALDMLQMLKDRGHQLAVATGKNRAGLDDALATAQLHDMFHATRTADETASKPHPRMLVELMQQCKVARKRTLMIGDTTHDLQMAEKAGTDAIGVSYGAHDATAFEDHSPRFVAHTMRELHDWLAAHA